MNFRKQFFSNRFFSQSLFPSVPQNIGEFIKNAVERLVAAGVDSPRLSAELILAHALGVRREYLLAHPELQIEDPTFDRFCDAVCDTMSTVARQIAGRANEASEN